MSKRNKPPKLSSKEAAAILVSVFAECKETPNTIPIEELESYSNFKKENLTVQRSVLIVVMVLFFFLPVFFVAPRYDIVNSLNEDRGLFTYDIDIHTRLPVRSVTAVMNGRLLPVYAASRYDYSIEPTSNGIVEITVTLFSGQTLSKEVDFISSDVDAPKYLGTSIVNGQQFILLEDTGSGVNYESIYVLDENEEYIYPAEINEEEGSVKFDRIINGLPLYLEDNFGNGIRLKLVEAEGPSGQ